MRIVEAYLGEYAAGKSEIAINRALELAGEDRNVTLVDLDPIRSLSAYSSLWENLKDEGIGILYLEPGENLEPSESGEVPKTAVSQVLDRPEDIVFDLSFGTSGVKMLNQIEGTKEDPGLRRILVANFSRPLLAEADDLVEYAHDLGRIDALIVNTHLSEETTPATMIEDIRKAVIAAYKLSVPIDAVVVSEDFIKKYPNFAPVNDFVEVGREKYPLRVLKRYLL